MIVRLWHGRTDISKADEYAEFMKERAAPVTNGKNVQMDPIPVSEYSHSFVFSLK